jgi:hypothetical protein
MTYVIGLVISAIAFAIFTGMRVDRFYHVVSYRKEKVLDTEFVVTHCFVGALVLLAWPLALGAAVAAVPLYGAFLFGKKLKARKEKTDA